MSRTLDLIIHSGTVVAPETGRIEYADLGISEGRITEISTEIDRSRDRELVDAAEIMVLPGIIDTHVHMDKRFPHLDRSEAPANLAMAGVSTAVELAQFKQVVREWKVSDIGLMVLGLQMLPYFEGGASAGEINKVLDDMPAHGAFSVKILGGHYPTPRTDAVPVLDETDKPQVSFNVNRRLTAHMQAGARVSSEGAIAFEGPGAFVVDAIASDGGSWRNVILDQGILFVELGVLTWPELAWKTSLRPAQMFGLHAKGKIQEGADADLIVVDRDRRAAETTIASGGVIAKGGKPRVQGTGLILTTPAGRPYLEREGISHAVVDLADSVFQQGRHAFGEPFRERV